MIEDLVLLGKIAGIGGISLGVFLLLFRELVRKQIFPTLTKRDAYRLIRLFMCLTFFVAVLGIAAWLFGDRFPESSGRPYVLPATAFWRNGLTEAVVQFKNSGSSPAYHNRTQIEFFATTEKSDDQKLDWTQMLPALSDNTIGPGEMYNTPALTRLDAAQGADILTGKAAAYVYGTVRYKDSPDSKKDFSERFCWFFDATRSQAFVGCPAAAMR